MLFEWDEKKRQTNLVKHHIDFEDVRLIFDGLVFEKMEQRRGEKRIRAIGLMEGIEIVVIYVMRGDYYRIISARRAHRHERQDYQNHIRNASKRQNGF